MVTNLTGKKVAIFVQPAVHILQVPKLLLHRLFPNVRYSIWIDGKLELVVDPYQVLERLVTSFDMYAYKMFHELWNSKLDF